MAASWPMALQDMQGAEKDMSRDIFKKNQVFLEMGSFRLTFSASMAGGVFGINLSRAARILASAFPQPGPPLIHRFN
jgi:hypothetical protein